MLRVALKYGNKLFGEDWTFQQDGARPHTHHLTQQWCRDHFPSFIEKDRWPAHSPDLNPLGYSIWDQLAKGINWDRIETQADLIDQLKRATKKFEPKLFSKVAILGPVDCPESLQMMEII